MRQVKPSGVAPEGAPRASLRSGVLTVLAAVVPCGVVVAVLIANPHRDAALRDVPGVPRPAAAAPRGVTAAPPASAPVAPVPAGPVRPPDVVGGPLVAAPRSAPPPAPAVDPAIERATKRVLEQTEALDRTVFAREVEAQEYERYFIDLWDAFRAAPADKLAILERAPFDTLSFAGPGAARRHDWDITVTPYDDAAAAQSLDAAGWRALVGRVRAAGYEAAELEFHQSEFTHDAGQPARSTVSTLVHLVNPGSDSRQVLRAKLKVEWSDRRAPASAPAAAGAKAGVAAAAGPFLPRTVDVTDLSIADRPGGVAFEPVMLPRSTPHGLWTTEASGFILVYDLDGDGRSEILFPGENLLLRNRGGWRFDGEQMIGGAAAGRRGAAVIADFTGDGLPDLLCFDGVDLHVARGIPGGRFSPDPYEPAVTLPFTPDSIGALTAGDVDGDGDLDAWFGQYKIPYAGGQMPTPYYDANDGLPAALLVNDGTGRFTDGTEAAGLAAKRHRRTLAGSFIDLDGDRDLDLLVNSDFAGLDVYYNDGKGRFTDVTDRVIDERHNFGMGHTFADFNLDGALDVYTIGMSSTTARRLTAMGAGRDEFPEYQAKRPQMGYGNRLFLAPAPGTAGAATGAPARYVQPPYRDDVARTGWSWGTSAADFDNDGDPDIFVANGHRSGTTCRDYCTTYWRRDVYLASSKEDPVMENLFIEHGIPREVSWNGFEHDVLYMNEGGRGFINVAHLMGVAFESDGRNVITDDFDGDGKMDLIVSERRWAERSRYVQILRNAWPTRHHWVGVRLAESRPGYNPTGAEVRVITAGEAGGGGSDPGGDGPRVHVARLVTGDSLTSQHANAKHFGLGARDRIEAIEVTWPNGEVTRVDRPAVNRWHDVRPAPPAPK
jgi:hypothetical protein